MPWCPKCRNEYVDGVINCADCGTTLVDELPEEIDPASPYILYTVKDEQIGAKFVAYLNYNNIRTAGLMPSPETEELHVVVAYAEKDAAKATFESFGSLEELADADIHELVPDLEKEWEDLQAEEASQKFSEIRSEASSLYVKKKDKYADLKFSGISFLAFGFAGIALLVCNALGYISLFNKFSTLIMGVVFIVFLGVGVTSLLRAKKMKNIVSEEENVTNDVLNWIDANITDEFIDSLVDDTLSEEDNYFTAHAKMCETLGEQYPFLNKSYIDQLMDDRYNDYCESK